jgi:hypothetical protein
MGIPKVEQSEKAGLLHNDKKLMGWWIAAKILCAHTVFLWVQRL